MIALVITIIVLLILAGITIAILTGENGLITKAQSSKTAINNAEIEEIETLNGYEQYIEKYIIKDLTGTTWKFKDAISNDNNIDFDLEGNVSNGTIAYNYNGLKTFEVMTYNVFAFNTSLDKIEEAGYVDGDALCYVPENSLGLQQGWSWANIKTIRCESTDTPTITITGGEDVTNLLAIEFLKQNAIVMKH